MSAFYNEHDPYAAQYLRNLIEADVIAPGVVDSRDIQEIEPWELIGYTQVHMFAGIGIWSGALRAAGWPDDEPIWTGSCPCQPFSNAGQKKGFSDDRHLWPFWRNLIAQCRPASHLLASKLRAKDGRIWLDIVSTDVEALGFAFGAADLCAAGFGGAHIRQRNYFVGLADDDDCKRQFEASGTEFYNPEHHTKSCGKFIGLADCDNARLERRGRMPQCGNQLLIRTRSLDGGMGHATHSNGRRGKRGEEAGIGENGERWRRLAGTN
jgi:site-specific DNA-cytosine methylase